MIPNRCKDIARLVPGIILGTGVACASFAQPSRDTHREYPSRPIRLIVPFVPGGGTDITARLVAERLTEALGQQVIIDNRPGAGGNIAGALVAHSAPDGHTLLAVGASATVNAAIYTKLSYDLVRDFSPITQTTSLPYTLVVNPSLAARSIKELVALARAKPYGVTYGSNGIGGLGHLAGELLGTLTHSKLLHVPYKGGAQALADLLAGQVNMLFSTPLQAAPHVRSGKLRMLAVTTRSRARVMPDVPTMIESGVTGYEITTWNALLTVGGTPVPIVARLHKETVRALDAIRDRLAKDGTEAVGGTPEELGALMRADIAKWKKLAQQIGIKPE